MDNSIQYLLALNEIKGIGPKLAKNLISYCGGVEQVFNLPKSKLLKVPSIGKNIVDILFSEKEKTLKKVEKEINYLQKESVQCIPYYHKNFPKRLTFCHDAPLFIYVKGEIDLNHSHVLSFVGTRHATEYGLFMIDKIIQELSQVVQPIIVSGLAYGIDIASHKTAMKYNLPTICVLANGFNKMYPSIHKKYSNQIIEQGGAWITEYSSDTIADKNNFPTRNRIIAGISDATIVIESAKKGGSMITANIAHSYERSVLAIPGRVNDTYSEGCNYLIKSQKASFCTSANDILYELGWEPQEKTQSNYVPKTDYSHLEKPEIAVVQLLQKQNGIAHIDAFTNTLKESRSNIMTLLLSMELKGVIKTQPGNIYKLQ